MNKEELTKLIDIIDIKKAKYLQFYVENDFIYCENKSGERVILAEHNDKAVDKVNWEINKLKSIEKEHIQVITDKEELYDKCDNMEQLYDKYYLPLLDIHYRKTYDLQQENKQLKDNWNKLKEWLSEQPIFDYLSPADIKVKMQELEKGDSNE